MEFHLRHDGVISRIWRGGRRADGVAGVIAVADRFGTNIYAVYRDAQLRIWSAKVNGVFLCLDDAGGTFIALCES